MCGPNETVQWWSRRARSSPLSVADQARWTTPANVREAVLRTCVARRVRAWSVRALAVAVADRRAGGVLEAIELLSGLHLTTISVALPRAMT